MNPYKFLRVSNALFTLMGLSFAVGATMGLGLGKMDMQLASADLLYALLALGIIICLVTFFGRSGLTGNDTHLKIYVVFVIFIIVGQALLGYQAIKEQDKVESYLRNKWVSSTSEIKSDIQLRLNCCGFHNNTDLSYKEGGDGKCVVGNSNPGCYSKLEEIQSKYSTLLKAFCFALLFVEVMCVGSGVTILRSGKPESYYKSKQ
eukprot:NODE_508_length_7458_cov_0.132491.p5 type:complete len:204 gc:universal NODE_508_length_7458_cov_0.132491:4279-3668(-)